MPPVIVALALARDAAAPQLLADLGRGGESGPAVPGLAPLLAQLPAPFADEPATLLLALLLAAILVILAASLRSGARRESLHRKQLDATLRAIEAQAAALDLQRDASARQLRAYVDVAAISFQRFAPGQDIVVRIELRNHGLTPARDLMPCFRLVVAPFPAADLPEVETAPEILPLTLAARETRALTQGLDLQTAPGVAERLLGAQLGLYLVGRVTYRDVFGVAHRTAVSLVATGERIRGRQPFLPCEAGNEAT
ncbi:hypothetical protein [Methylobacterium sp. JK268]